MNILTKNRILQKGDEYRDNGTWKAIPKNDIGLQIMFTDYKEVRRPSEAPPTKTISPDSEKLSPLRTTNEVVAGSTPRTVEAIVTAKAESDKTPAPSHSGAGVLPTVISRKAHLRPETERILATVAAMVKEAKAEKAAATDITIPFSAGTQAEWTGRNGTFNGYGLEMSVFDSMVSLYPIGKRGIGNCVIQFPAAIIPEVIDFLLRHEPLKTT